MSIIYDALKKIEGHNSRISSPEKSLTRDKKTKYKKKVLLIVIILFLGVAGARTYDFFKQKKILASNLAETEPTESNFQRKEALQAEKQEEVAEVIVKNEKIAVKNSQSSYKLEGIIFDKSNPFAIINGKQVYEGDNIGGFIVSKIKTDKVELFESESGENKTITIDF